MKRAELEHVVRAAGDIAGDTEIIVIGSQSILGQYPDAPNELTVSIEADVYPKNKPELWNVIDGSIGEGSPFHETHGYYAQGVGPETALLPAGWQTRLVRLKNENTGTVTGWCLEIHDLLVSKLLAGREKDLAFVRNAVRAKLAQVEELEARVADTEVTAELKRAALDRLSAL